VRVVGLDIHRVCAEAVMLDEGKVVRLGRVGMTRDHLGAFARMLTLDDHVVRQRPATRRPWWRCSRRMSGGW
jgi:transposase